MPPPPVDQEPVVVEYRTVYPAYYVQPPYYPPASVNLGFGYWGRHGHWR